MSDLKVACMPAFSRVRSDVTADRDKVVTSHVVFYLSPSLGLCGCATSSPVSTEMGNRLLGGGGANRPVWLCNPGSTHGVDSTHVQL